MPIKWIGAASYLRRDNMKFIDIQLFAIAVNATPKSNPKNTEMRDAFVTRHVIELLQQIYITTYRSIYDEKINKAASKLMQARLLHTGKEAKIVL